MTDTTPAASRQDRNIEQRGGRGCEAQYAAFILQVNPDCSGKRRHTSTPARHTASILWINPSCSGEGHPTLKSIGV